MKHKLTAGLLALSMLTAGVPLLPQAALTVCADGESEEPDYENVETDDYLYNRYSDHIELTYIFDTAGAVTVPDMLDGLPVTSVSAAFFEETTSVWFPDTVAEISCHFYHSPDLSEIRFPEGLRSLDGVDSLKETAWYQQQPDGMVCIGKVLYEYKGEMPEETALVIPEGIEVIARGAFRGCKNLTAVTFPESLEEIGANAFYGCSGIAEFNIPANVRSIGDEALLTPSTVSISFGGGFGSGKLAAIHVDPENQYYTDVDGVLFTKDMKTLLLYPFRRDAGEEDSYTVPDGVTTIGENAFYVCNLSKIVLPDSLETIENNAFEICTGIRSITLPQGLKTIGCNAFMNCRDLQSIVIPASVERVGRDAFCYADLYEITFENPDTEIDSAPKTIVNHHEEDQDGRTVYSYTGVIYGKEGSTAQVYAEENGCRFALHKGTEGIFTYNNCIDHIEITEIAYGDYETLPALDIPAEIEGLPVTSYYGSTVDGYSAVNLPATMQSMTYTYSGYFPFYDVRAINVAEDSPYYQSVDGVLYSKDMTELICCPERKEAESLTVPDGVTTLYGYSLDHIRIETVYLPESFRTIINTSDWQTEAHTGWDSRIKTVYGYDNTPAQSIAEYVEGEYISLGAAEITEPTPDTIHEDSISLGDLNGDGAVNAADGTLILIAASKRGAGEDAGLTDAQMQAADLDGNGEINAADATLVLQYAAYAGAGGEQTITDFLAANG